MIFAKLMVAKKFLQEKSVNISTSSSCVCPLGNLLGLETV